MKIYISGSAGSGKTTYAKELSKELDLPVYSTDDFYNPIVKRMYTLEEIKEKVPIDSDWIIEGAYYIPQYVRAADKVIYLEIGVTKTVYRIVSRWLKNKDVREKYSLLKTLKLIFTTTIRDRYLSKNIDVNTDVSYHYAEKDRKRLLKSNAKKYLELAS